MKLIRAASAVALVFLVGTVFSGQWEWYARYTHFDTLMHLLGGFVIAWFVAELLEHDVRKVTVYGALGLIVGATALVGIAWELAEYGSGLLFADAESGLLNLFYRYFHGGDLGDTLLDLIADILGALALSALYLPTRRARATPPQSAEAAHT
ncbi:MAG TPA: hypothetical protein VD862_01815 [Candidatus Paceibacterota bacterium]|nr:hypothetical protein [Candidatus Paceibacterota bacterium]